jgi:hypothetical protein
MLAAAKKILPSVSTQTVKEKKPKVEKKLQSQESSTPVVNTKLPILMPDFAGVNTDYTYIAIPYDKYA